MIRLRAYVTDYSSIANCLLNSPQVSTRMIPPNSLVLHVIQAIMLKKEGALDVLNVLRAHSPHLLLDRFALHAHR